MTHGQLTNAAWRVACREEGAREGGRGRDWDRERARQIAR